MLDPDAAVASPSPIRDFLDTVRGTQMAAMLCYCLAGTLPLYGPEFCSKSPCCDLRVCPV